MAIIIQAFMSKSRTKYNQHKMLQFAGLMHTQDSTKEAFRPTKIILNLKEGCCFFSSIIYLLMFHYLLNQKKTVCLFLKILDFFSNNIMLTINTKQENSLKNP